MWNRRVCASAAAAILAAVLAPPTLRACNPEFPNSVIGVPDKALLAAPVADFRAELARIPAAHDPGVKAIPPKDYASWMDDTAMEDQTDAAELADLRAALPQSPASEKVVAALKTWRANLRKAANTAGPLPAGLPEEFALYEQGALLYHKKDLAGARAQWQKLLALPEKSRRFRTVWATYMIGRTYSEADPATAVKWFPQVRTAAKGGFADSIGLAAVSLGWEARAYWQLDNWKVAVELFLEELHAGDEIAPWSLRDVAAAFLAGEDKRLAAAAQVPMTRQLITAYLAAQGGPENTTRPNDLGKKVKRWLELVAAGNPTDLRGADRLAWVAYQANDVAAADRWLKLGGKEGEQTPLGQWIRAKLLLKQGQVEQATACLARAAAGFPKNEEWNDAAPYAVVEEGVGYRGDLPWRPAAHAAGELAALKLGRAQFVDALDILYRNNFWGDAAYIAECVLTPDELKTYVEKNFRDHESGTYPLDRSTDHRKVDQVSDTGIRYLLARRLTRVGRWQEARPFFPAKLQPILDQYIAGIRDGHDARKTNAEKAAALWSAARIARYQGMELLGTELAPDGGITDGAFDEGTQGEAKTRPAENLKGRSLAPFTKEEQQRLAKLPEVLPDKRFHYRYIACDHAWEAAALLQDNTDELAKVLVEAGSWLSARDPKAVDRFYKALVARCPKTALGQQAVSLKWLPPYKS
jgi:hypothetical protein